MEESEKCANEAASNSDRNEAGPTDVPPVVKEPGQFLFGKVWKWLPVKFRPAAEIVVAAVRVSIPLLIFVVGLLFVGNNKSQTPKSEPVSAAKAKATESENRDQEASPKANETFAVEKTAPKSPALSIDRRLPDWSEPWTPYARGSKTGASLKPVISQQVQLHSPSLDSILHFPYRSLEERVGTIVFYYKQIADSGVVNQDDQNFVINAALDLRHVGIRSSTFTEDLVQTIDYGRRGPSDVRRLAEDITAILDPT